MGQPDTERIDHDIQKFINTFRRRRLAYILNELDEESQGKGVSEVVRSGAFVSSIIVYTDGTKTQKKTETTFNRSGVFVSSIVKQFFDRETGTTVVAEVIASVTRNANNFVTNVDVQVTRP